MSCDRLLRFVVLALSMAVGPCRIAAADVLLRQTPVPRQNGIATFVYRLDQPATGRGFLDLVWSDALGREVDRRRITFELVHGERILFRLDLHRAVTMENELIARLSFIGDAEGTKRRSSASKISFPVQPQGNAWSDYQAIMWQSHRAEQCAALKSLGVTAGAIFSVDRENPGDSVTTQAMPLLTCGLRWYVENIATDFYSAYHRWFADRPVNWRFAASKKAYQEDPSNLGALMRDPSFSDPAWQDRVNGRLTRTVLAYSPYAPLYYSLGDEPGIADLSAAWDFDFSARSLAEMRRWLAGQYRTLAALNRQWGSHFAAWRDVLPQTTAQAMKRSDENYSAWADFKSWMDVAFARAIKRGTLAVHAADSSAYAAIEGAQIPGWGGYDYSRLATATDAMEIYDGGGNVEIARSLNPTLVMLTTSSSSGEGEAHDIWRELLRGAGGVILWDPTSQIVADDATIGPRGRDLAAPLHEIEAGIGALLRHSPRESAPIAVLYSPASMRTQWMLDWRPRGDAWSARDAQSDYEDDSAVRSSMVGFLDLLERRGLEPHIVVSELLERGALRHGGYRALILPRAIALSARAADEIRRFAEKGGLVIADGEPGIFDEHSRRLATPRFADLDAGASASTPTTLAIGKGRGLYVDPVAAPQRLDLVLAQAGIVAPISVSQVTGEPVRDVGIYQWRNGSATVLALQRDGNDDAGAVEPAAHATKTDDATPMVLTLPGQAYVYDLREKRFLGRSDRLTVMLDPSTPVLLSISPVPRAAPVIVAPKRVRRGEIATLRFAVPRSDRGVPVFHVTVIDPSGNIVPYGTSNLSLYGRSGVRLLPLAFNDQTGRWHIRAEDVLSGKTTSTEIAVAPR